MFDKLAYQSANWIKKQNPEQTSSIAVLQFALTGIFNSLTVFIIVIVIGSISGHFVDSLVASFFFMLLHFFSGGHHFKSAIICTLFSSTMIITSILIPLTNPELFGISIITILIVAIFSPSNIEGHARIPKKYFPILKAISVGIVMINFFLQKDAVAFALMFQAILILPYNKMPIKRRLDT